MKSADVRRAAAARARVYGDTMSPVTPERARRVMWSSMFGKQRLAEERIRAAAAAGFETLAISWWDQVQAAESGRRPEDIAAEAASHGIDLSIWDSIREWYPYIVPKRPQEHLGVPPEAVVESCARFGVTTLVAVSSFDTELSHEEIAGHYGALCDLAAPAGIDIALEFTPFRPIIGLAPAWEIVQRAARPNGKLLMDTWHFFRSDSSLDLLATIPGDRIAAVQASDGEADLQMSLVKATFIGRRMPGEGGFALAELLGILRRNGGLRALGPEVLETSILEQPTEAIARIAWKAQETLEAMAAAGPEA